MFHLWYYFRRRTRTAFQPVILITGCSSGVGLALARLLHKDSKYRVVITSRKTSMARLREEFQESDRFLIRDLDVTDEIERDRVVTEITKLWGGVNILVNNAGISYRAVLEHMTEGNEQHQMATNYLGPVGLIRLVLPFMRQQGRGKIINISSVSGMLAMPTMASYSASKHALEGMSEALWYEVKPLGINVSLIQPGFIRSASFKNVYYTERSRPEAGWEGVYGDYYENMTPFIGRLMRMSLTDPYSVAKTVIKVVQTENPPLWIPSTYDAMIFYYLRRTVPRRILLPLLFMALPNARRWGRKYTNRRR